MTKLRNCIPCVMGMAADTTLRFLIENVVLALLDRLRREKTVEFVAARMFTGPALNGAEHVSLDLNMLVTKGGMMECSQNVIDDFINGYIGVLPSVEHTAFITTVRKRGHVQ